MNAALSLSGRDTLNTVDSAFILEHAEHILPADLHHNFLEAANIGRAGLQRLHFPAPGFSETAVHAHQIRREEGGLITAGARTDFQQRITAFERIRWQDGKLNGALQCGHFLFDDRDFSGCHGGEFFITAFQHVLTFRQFMELLLILVPIAQKIAELPVLTRHLAGSFRLVKKARLAHQLLQEMKA